MRSAPLSFDLRIGIATGEALVGSIGSARMMNYTVVGNMPNLVARLESANKIYGSRILVSEATALGAAANGSGRLLAAGSQIKLRPLRDRR